jgi:hypothetical protein
MYQINITKPKFHFAFQTYWLVSTRFVADHNTFIKSFHKNMLISIRDILSRRTFKHYNTSHRSPRPSGTHNSTVEYTRTTNHASDFINQQQENTAATGLSHFKLLINYIRFINSFVLYLNCISILICLDLQLCKSFLNSMWHVSIIRVKRLLYKLGFAFRWWPIVAERCKASVNTKLLHFMKPRYLFKSDCLSI